MIIYSGVDMPNPVRDFFQNIFGIKSDPAYAMYTQIMSPGQPVYTPRDFSNLAKYGYEKNVFVYKGISLIAETCGGIPWKLVKKSDKRRTIEEHPLLDLLNTPNPRHGLGTFIEEIVSFWILSGNSYIYAVRPNKRATPTELWVMRPDRMRVVPGLKAIDGYEYNLDGHKEYFDSSLILHLKMFSAINDWYGLSPVAVASALVDQMNEGFDWNTALLQNAGRPSGALVASGTLGNDQYERLKKVIRERYTGKRNSGTPMLLEGGLDWKQFSMSPMELDWGESRKQNMRDISIALGVPPELLGDSSNKTYSNYGEARKSFYQETILPLMDKLRDRLNSWLVPMFDETLILDYDKEQVEALQEDRDSLNTRVMAQWGAGVVTLNEVRTLLGLSEVKGGDIFKLTTANTAYVPDDQLQQVTAQMLQALLQGSQQQAAPQQSDPSQTGQDLGENTAQSTPGPMKPAQDGDPSDSHDQVLGDEGEMPDNVNKSAPTVPSVAYRPIKRVLEAQRNAVIANVKHASLPKTTVNRALLALDMQPFQKVIERLSESAGQSGYYAIKASLEPYTKKDDDSSYWNDAMQRYMEEQAGKRIKDIHDATRDGIQKQLSEGVANGETVEQLTDRLHLYFSDEKLERRSRVIAQTEWTAAYNFGGRVAAISSGAPVQKQWIAKSDVHTRKAHSKAHGQTTELYEPFMVDGEKLMHPGDSSQASAKNTVNCRCEQKFILPQKTDGFLLKKKKKAEYKTFKKEIKQEIK
jgi:HK97 family phage portal protein